MFRIAVVALAGWMTLALPGCVRTTEGVFTNPADPQETLSRRVELARKYIGEDDWENAKRNLKIAQDINPKDPEVHEAFGLVYQNTGEFELAEKSFKQAIALDKSFSRARNNYAAFLFSQERFAEAEVQLEYVVADSLYNRRPQAFVNLGLSRLQLSDPEGAEEAFLRTLAMERTNTIALLEVAHIRFDRKDFKSAQSYYDTYRTIMRQQSPRGLWLGIRLARESGDRDAEASYALALRNIYPQSAEFQAYRQSIDRDV